MTELLFCPFCGGEARAWKYSHPTRGEYWRVACNEPFCCISGDRPTEAEAIAAWNTRSAGTCENANLYGYSRRFECSACGYSVIAHNCEERIDEIPNYCPNCGRKVTA